MHVDGGILSENWRAGHTGGLNFDLGCVFYLMNNFIVRHRDECVGFEHTAKDCWRS